MNVFSLDYVVSIKTCIKETQNVGKNYPGTLPCMERLIWECQIVVEIFHPISEIFQSYNHESTQDYQ